MREIPIKIKHSPSPRQRLIFKILIEKYIEKGAPVSSGEIKKEGRLEISPATIRLELTNLEEQGLIKHLYSSSGSVPTDYGYRFFINYLMEEEPFSREELSEELKTSWSGHYNEAIKRAVDLLAAESNQIGWGSLPSGEVYTAGLRNFLENYPEFLDRRLLKVMAVMEKLKEYLSSLLEIEDYQIFVGKESPIKELEDFSLMIAPYKFNDWGTKGILGTIGSKRVAYHKVKPLLVFLSNFITNQGY